MWFISIHTSFVGRSSGSEEQQKFRRSSGCYVTTKEKLETPSFRINLLSIRTERCVWYEGIRVIQSFYSPLQTSTLHQTLKEELKRLLFWLQVVDEEFDALEGFFAVLDHGILQLLENVETYLLNLQVIPTSAFQPKRAKLEGLKLKCLQFQLKALKAFSNIRSLSQKCQMKCL